MADESPLDQTRQQIVPETAVAVSRSASVWAEGDEPSPLPEAPPSPAASTGSAEGNGSPLKNGSAVHTNAGVENGQNGSAVQKGQGAKRRKSAGKSRLPKLIVQPAAERPKWRLRDLIGAVPAWFSSLLVHAAVLLALGGITLAPEVRESLISLVVNPPSDSPDLPEAPIETQTTAQIGEEDVEGEYVEVATGSVGSNDRELESIQSVEAPDPTDTAPIGPGTLDLGGVLDASMPGGSGLLASLSGGMGGGGLGDLSLRGDEEARKKAALERGGTKESEAAVADALEWLAAHQDSYGSWSFDHTLSACQGRCRNPGSLGHCRLGATGLALMSFLGAGQTQKSGKYKQQVQLGLNYLVQNMRGGRMDEQGGFMYSHGIGSIALCEAYAMTKDPRLRDPAQSALNYIVEAQDPRGGGWRYFFQQPGDTSVVGWQVMALKSGHMAYLEVPQRTVAGASFYLDYIQGDLGATYGYVNPGVGTKATTAVGLLCRMYLGWKREMTPLKNGVKLLSQWGPSLGNSDMYYNYYATQVMHHWEGPEWSTWNLKMRNHLVNTQMKKGHEKGSWFFDNNEHRSGADAGGRLYTTALAVMTLEVYYRHLPLYRAQSTEDEFDD